jgi:hypothetical protein
MHGGKQRAIQPEHAQFSIVFVFIARMLGDLDNHPHDFG